VTPDAPKHNIKKTFLSGNCFSKLSEKVNYQGRLLLTEEFVGELREEIDDALEHLAGFICHQIDLKPDKNARSNFSWTDQLCEGGLTKPSGELMLHMQELEKIFNDTNGDWHWQSQTHLYFFIENVPIKSSKNDPLS
jgi:hypothetical protein